MSTRILTVDDHPLVRQGLTGLISTQPDFEICGEASGIVEAQELVATTRPDVAIIDLTLKDGNGIELIKILKVRHPELKMLVISMHDESLFAERALRAGAAGYVSKHEAIRTLVQAVRTILAGRLYLSPTMTERMVHLAVGVRGEGPSSPLERSTDREIEIFEMIGRGLTSRQIAQQLNLSPKTVETHRERVKEKLELKNTVELTTHAVQWVTISGPAAGLAPVLYAGMIGLGGGDLAIGYPRVLVAICIAGPLQLVLAKFRVARLSAIFPAAAIEGMLAAIGLLIIVKQVPLFFGHPFAAHEFWGILEEIPFQLSLLDPQVFGLGIACLVLIFGLAAVPSRLLKVMPPPVWAFFLGTLGAGLFLHLKPSSLINVPEAPLANGIVLPDFAGVLGDHSLWLNLSLLVVTLVLIDGTESLATIAAVDKLDPFRRKSNPDRTLSAMGVSNMASSVLGGLTIIPGIVKSTANILGGGRTQWANFYNASFLLVFLVFGRNLINLVPMCVLASILVFVGYKLCGPKVWKHVAMIGKEQFAIFTVTVLVTVSTDLLLGIGVGVAMKYGLCLWNHLSDAVVRPSNPRGLAALLADPLRNPVTDRRYQDGVYDLYLRRPVVCFNLFHLIREMDHILPDAAAVRLHLTDDVSMVDHTSCENLFHYLEQFNSQDGKPSLEIRGFERMRRLSSDDTCIRVADREPLAVGATLNEMTDVSHAT